MYPLLLLQKEIDEGHKALIGGKASALWKMYYSGLKVPDFLVLTTAAYDRFVDSNGLRGRIALEFTRKSFDEMRWEEIWDTSLRIRNMFSRAVMPSELGQLIISGTKEAFGTSALVVRSSAKGEDSANTSFAGLHASYVNISGANSLLEHVKLVWASLWSDAALMYRRELDLDIEQSSMAVIVQELVSGERSGIMFTASPQDPGEMIVEAVYGLNKGLVDGEVEPDRWTIERTSGNVKEHRAPLARDMAMLSDNKGTYLGPLPEIKRSSPPLTDCEVREVCAMGLQIEQMFGSAQDIEWTIRADTLFLLQARPVTTFVDKDSNRQWYLSLTRSLSNLQQLKKQIEHELVPAMVRIAGELEGSDLTALKDEELAGEIEKRRDVFNKWKGVYWEHFIPFAHGMRLFAQVYNDLIKPEDPYEFMELLKGEDLMSLRRNRELAELAYLMKSPSSGLPEDVANEFGKRFSSYLTRWGTGDDGTDVAGLKELLVHIGDITATPERSGKTDAGLMERNFLNRFEGEEKKRAAELLELARTSYRMRDDDNIYLDRIEGQLKHALHEGLARLRSKGIDWEIEPEEIMAALLHEDHVPEKRDPEIPARDVRPRMHIRQIQGQPASKGITSGMARVIRSRGDLFKLQKGEVMICDAIEPSMTFVVPLVSGIVERRGGMLIHGAIIAREYGIPCVTGIPDATNIINTGDMITVDGYLGIIVIQKADAT